MDLTKNVFQRKIKSFCLDSLTDSNSVLSDSLTDSISVLSDSDSFLI